MIFPKVKQEWRDTRLVYWVKNCKYTRKRPNKDLGHYDPSSKTVTLIIVPGEFSSVKAVALLHELIHHWLCEFKIPKLGVLLDTKTCYLLFGQFYRLLSVFEFHVIDRFARKLRRQTGRGRS